MSGNRIDISEEAMLWKAALDHFGQADLHQLIVELWQKAGPPARPTVEYIDEDEAGPVLINLLKIAQVEVGAVVPFREEFPKRVTLYSRHAQHLVAGLLERMPADQLTRPMRIARLENQVGL
ncbi:hypothetical protein [Pseudomonas sp. BN607]|uniref:hypothetical protein n=1 Tax=Pseudomonas sp. BN607 TaxID=2567895 RepID=UPI002454D431|nr:hypothetical protein [Pseudomonas sp. BN607]MDH4552746.1 hypothetical protein [Pseudomonas sp. BN607]